MKFRDVALVLMSIVLSSTILAANDLAGRVESALTRAGSNITQLRNALDEIPDSQREGMQFLIAYMPEHDLQSLSAEFLLSHVQCAYRAWNEAPWKERIPKELFLNDILPYASINERRDDWRADFYQRFKPLIAQAKSPSEAAIILNREIFKMLKVQFSRQRPKADQSPYETINAGTASCTGLSVLLIDACRAVGVPARLAGTPLWTDKSGNHTWVEIWDGRWHYTGASEPAGDALDQAWFTAKAVTAQRDHRLHAIYAVSYQHTDQKFPLVWDPDIDYVYAVNVTDRYAEPQKDAQEQTNNSQKDSHFDVEASLHAVDQLKTYLQTPQPDRLPLSERLFAQVPLTQKDARQAQDLLWADHIEYIRKTRTDEMTSRQLTMDGLTMPFFFSVTGDKPQDGRSLYISLHGGGGAPKQANDSQWDNQKKLYKIPEGVYLAPRAPNDAWDMWHQGHIDGMFDRLIENLIVFEDVNPNRVYLLGYSAGGDGVYRLAPRMADRWAAASMMAGHPGEASAVNLYNTPFTIHVGENDTPYNRNRVAVEWGQKLDELKKNEPNGYVHWTEIHKGKGHWMDNGAGEAIPWMAQYTRDPLPRQIIWRQDKHQRFYWLAVEQLQPAAVVRASLNAQEVNLQTEELDELIIRFNDSMLNLDEQVRITARGKELFKGHLNRTIATLAKTLAERGDQTLIFSSEQRVRCKQ
ncbi:MAG: transglutaminase domain-containing protein [Anaerohalosphaeraceae bacterium]